MCRLDVPISEQDIIKLSEAIRVNKYKRVTEHLLHKDQLQSMEHLHAGKEKVKGSVGEGSKGMDGTEKLNRDHCLF